MLVPDFWGSIGQRSRRSPHVATKLITEPTVEPFTSVEAKLHLKITATDDDANVTKWIRAARTKVERDTGRALLTQTWDLLLDAGDWYAGSLLIPYPPLQSVTSVNQTDSAGAETVWSAANYVVDTASVPGRLALTDTGVWPTGLRQFQPLRIRFVAGWTGTTPNVIPGDLLAAMALVMGWLSENRQPAPIECEAYNALIAPYTVFVAA